MWKLEKNSGLDDRCAFLKVIGVGKNDWPGWKAALNLQYRSVRIPKRRCGHRTLLVPSHDVMEQQRRLLKALYLALSYPQHVTGGVPEGSIRKHAQPHVNRAWVATFDIRDFFGQVKGNALFDILVEIGFPSAFATHIIDLCFLNGTLPQGAPTSPLLANLALTTLDLKILKLAKRHGLRYTRYLDDMAFSGNQDFRSLRGPIAGHCQRAGFSLHEEKERFMAQGTQQVVTGLVVNHKLRPTSDFYRRLQEDLQALTIVENTARRRSLIGRQTYLAQFTG